MTTTYEVRRGKAVITTLEDADRALAIAEANSHPGMQLQVYVVIRDEYPITSPPAEPIPFKGSDRTAHKRRA